MKLPPLYAFIVLINCTLSAQTDTAPADPLGTWLYEQVTRFRQFAGVDEPFQNSGFIWRAGVNKMYQSSDLNFFRSPPANLGLTFDLSYKYHIIALGLQYQRGFWQPGSNLNVTVGGTGGAGYLLGPVPELRMAYASLFIPFRKNGIEIRGGWGEALLMDNTGIVTLDPNGRRGWLSSGGSSQVLNTIQQVAVIVPMSRHVWLSSAWSTISNKDNITIDFATQYPSMAIGVQLGSGKGKALDNLNDPPVPMEARLIHLRAGRSFLYQIRRGAAATAMTHLAASIRLSDRIRLTTDYHLFPKRLGTNIAFTTEPLSNTGYDANLSFLSAGFKWQFNVSPSSLGSVSLGSDRFFSTGPIEIDKFWGTHLGLGWETALTYTEMFLHVPFEDEPLFIGFRIGFQLQAF
jgi:hypothetical protein